MSDKRIADLKLVLINLDWSGLNQLNKANYTYVFFINKFTETYNSCLPIENKFF